MKITYNIIRIIASLFSIVFATIYFAELAGILKIEKIYLYLVSAIILGIFEMLNISMLTKAFDKFFAKELKQFFTILPFALFLFAISFYLTANGAKILANKYLSQEIKTETNSNDISLLKINNLQATIDSLSQAMPQWKSGRELQATKIKAYQKQIEFWQKQYALNQQNISIVKKTQNTENQQIALNYYYVSSVIMILIFMINFYFVYFKHIEKQEVIPEMKNITTEISDEELYKVVMKEKSAGKTQKQIAEEKNLSTAKVSRLITKYRIYGIK